MNISSAAHHGSAARVCTVVLLTALFSACTPGSNSPTNAVENYYDANVNNSRGGLERHWWISEDEAMRDAVIDLSLALAEYNDALDRKAAREIAELTKSGRIKQVGSKPTEPSGAQIKAAIKSAWKDDTDGSLRVMVQGQRSVSVAQYNGKWYVRHPNVRAGRKWAEKDLNFYTELGEMYQKFTQELKSQGLPISGQLGLRFFLSDVQQEQSRIMKKYEVPLLVF